MRSFWIRGNLWGWYWRRTWFDEAGSVSVERAKKWRERGYLDVRCGCCEDKRGEGECEQDFEQEMHCEIGMVDYVLLRYELL